MSTDTTPAARYWRIAAIALRLAAMTLAGLLLWLLGLFALDVPAELATWRHWLGVALMVGAVHVWRKSIVDAPPCGTAGLMKEGE